MPRTFVLIWLCAAVSALCAAVHTALAESQTVLTRTVRVVDPDGKPVAGAFVIPWSINENFFWPDRSMKRTSFETDAAGLAEVKYPQFADYGSVKLLVESIKLSVYHEGFREGEASVPVPQGAAAKEVEDRNATAFEIRLERGISLKLSAVDQAGKPLTEPYSVAITGSPVHSRWKRPAPHIAQSQSIKPGNHQIMLFQARADGRHLFSEVLSYHFDAHKEPEVSIDEIELQPGIPLSGRLEDKVPRPVKNGFVIAAHAPLPLGNTYEDQLPSLIYYSSADIREDGSFEFPSMPLTGSVQLIALCDQWVGLKGERPSIEGQSFDVEIQASQIVLSMERTFDAKIRVLDQDGKPVDGIALVATPNQYYRKAGSNILGNRFDSAAMLASQLTNRPKCPHLDITRFMAVSDKQGHLVIRNLPHSRYSQSFECWSTDQSSVVIKSNENLEGKLPNDDEHEIEYDVTVEVIQRKTIAQPGK